MEEEEVDEGQDLDVLDEEIVSVVIDDDQDLEEIVLLGQKVMIDLKEDHLLVKEDLTGIVMDRKQVKEEHMEMLTLELKEEMMIVEVIA